MSLSFHSCGLAFEIHCNDELEKVAAPVIRMFASSGPGEHHLYLNVLPGNFGENGYPPGNTSAAERHSDKVIVNKWTSNRIDIRLFPGNRALVAAAIGYLLFSALQAKKGIILHAATMIHDGKAYIFLGKSGAGKTTMAQNATGMQCIHDEKVAVRRLNGTWWAFGIPMLNGSGVAGVNLSAPVAGVYFIEKGSIVRKTQLKSKSALAEIPAHTVVPYLNPLSVKRTFASLLSLVSEVECWHLSFKRDSNVSKVV